MMLFALIKFGKRGPTWPDVSTLFLLTSLVSSAAGSCIKSSGQPFCVYWSTDRVYFCLLALQWSSSEEEMLRLCSEEQPMHGLK